jgi:serine/threonine-protein kinase RsbW
MKDETRFIELRIPNEFGYEKIAMDLAGAVAQRMGFATERVEALKTAVAEACLNAIEHGNQLDASTRVLVLFSIDADRLAIDVKDEGRGGPPPDHFPEPDISRKVAGREALRHMGIYVIQRLVDEAGFVEPELGSGNQFRMVIHLQAQEGQGQGSYVEQKDRDPAAPGRQSGHH